MQRMTDCRDLTRQKGLDWGQEAVGVIRTYMGETKGKIRVILVCLFVQTGADPQALLIRMVFSSWYREGTFLKENSMTCF